MNNNQDFNRSFLAIAILLVVPLGCLEAQVTAPLIETYAGGGPDASRRMRGWNVATWQLHYDRVHDGR